MPEVVVPSLVPPSFFDVPFTWNGMVASRLAGESSSPRRDHDGAFALSRSVAGSKPGLRRRRKAWAMVNGLRCPPKTWLSGCARSSLRRRTMPRKSQFTGEQIIRALREVDAGAKPADVCAASA